MVDTHTHTLPRNTFVSRILRGEGIAQK